MAPIMPFKLLSLLALLPACLAVTVYYAPGQTPVSIAPEAQTSAFNGLNAYNPTKLLAPPAPTQKPGVVFDIPLRKGQTDGLGAPVGGYFVGFSIEMSVANQVLGKNSSLLEVPFLNLMAGLIQRSGHVRIRIGGNSQEDAHVNPGDATLENGRIIIKDKSRLVGTTGTPSLLLSRDLVVLMRKISDLVNIRWFTGVPFADPADPGLLDLMKTAQKVLGDHLIGIQVGNEPDLYADRRRPGTYTQSDYFGEFGDFIKKIANDPEIPVKNALLGPSISKNWTPESVWDTGFLDAYIPSISFLTVERYPTDNCQAVFGIGTVRPAQGELTRYLSHNQVKFEVDNYRASTALGLSKGRRFIMFETNTAACGGFPGISDAFVAALWGIDYTLQLAAASFEGAMIHVGGHNASYNPFTPPPTGESVFRKWTVGPMYYVALIVAEALGSSNKSQVMDLNMNDGNEYTPGYAIYEDGQPVRLALINFQNDASGASEFTARVSVGGGNTGTPVETPGQVKVKFLAASEVIQKGNFTWGGQTFGTFFESDGRIKGDEDIKTIPCNNGICEIKVPAPGMALVFMNDDALTDKEGASPTTFATTARTRTRNTATIDASVLSTSNGHAGLAAQGLSTSHGSGNKSGAERTLLVGVLSALVAMVVPVIMVFRS